MLESDKSITKTSKERLYESNSITTTAEYPKTQKIYYFGGGSEKEEYVHNNDEDQDVIM